MEFADACIMVFTRAPIPGQVKTRLIPGLGETVATTIHEYLVRHCLSVAVNADLCPVHLWCDSAPDHLLFQQLSAMYSVGFFTQTEGDLGKRMHHAFYHSLQSREYCLIVGTDCPALNAENYRQALAALKDGNDAVIIPAEDGGYVLLGLRNADSRVFEDVRWGSAGVFEQTVQRFSALDYTWKQLPALWDVDRPDDVARMTNEADTLNLPQHFSDYLKHQSGAVPTH